jgi:hypothetical protein
VQGVPVLEKLLMIHGVVYFWITPRSKERGELVNGSHWKKDMVESLAKII